MIEPLGRSRERKKVTPETAATTAECQDLMLSWRHLGRSMVRLSSRMVSEMEGVGLGVGGAGLKGAVIGGK